MLGQRCMGCMEMYESKEGACPYCGFNQTKYKKIGYHLEPQTVLADTYVIGKSIGSGGFGITYVAYNALLAKKVAIKEYLPGEFATRRPGEKYVLPFSGEKEMAYNKGLQQFEQEAKKLATLTDNNGIVKIYDCFRENNTVYIVMECLHGETLKTLIDREGRVKEETATQIIVKILDALMEVHRVGMIHRDISPENIFITKANEVKLMDFGAARYSATEYSKSLSVIVKQGYAPPEQYYSRGKQGSWTDIYGVAAVYYKMLTGVTPEDSMERKAKDTLVAPSKYGVKINKNRENMLMNGLELDAERRVSSAKEFKIGLVNSSVKIKRIKADKKKPDIGKISVGAKIGICTCFFVIMIAFLVGYNVVRNNEINDTLVISEDMVYVPYVENMEYEEAKVLLENIELEPKVHERKNSDIVPPATVLEQEIPYGELVKKGTVINLVISNGGTGNIYIEAYIGMDRKDVVNRLDELQLYGEFQEVESSVAKGCIVSQSESYEQSYKKGNVISFQVSKGMENLDSGYVNTPSLVGMDYDKAIDIMKEESLYIKPIKRTYSDTIPKGEIISQNVAANQQILAGSVVEVEISGGVQMVRVPYVDNAKIKEAKKILEETGLEVKVDYSTASVGTATCVQSISLNSGELVPIGSQVVIYASVGVAFEAWLKTPSNDGENVYKVGDEIAVVIEIEADQKGLLLGWEVEYGLKYDKDMLQFNGVTEGDVTVSNVNAHTTYGDCLLINYTWNEEEITDTVTLSFTVIAEGEAELSLFEYLTQIDEQTYEAHLWASEPVYDENFSFSKSIGGTVDLTLVK